MKHFIGIDIGGTGIKAGVVDGNGKILAKGAVATQAEEHYSVIVKDMAELTKRLIAEAGLTPNDISGVGMGIPGTINSEDGIITYSNNINFENVPVVAEFKKHLDLPVKINNDANCAALGEVVFGSGKGCKEACFVTLGTGVGSGIVINGKIFEGKKGAGAEAGHTCIVSGGAKCTCGRRGCWEAYASATALIRMTKEALARHPQSAMHRIVAAEGKVSGRTAFKGYKEHDPVATRVVKTYIRYVAEGLINLANLFRPEVIMIGGGISNEGQYVIDMLQKAVDKNAYGGARNPRVAVVRAALLNDAGILGAAALVI